MLSKEHYLAAAVAWDLVYAPKYNVKASSHVNIAFNSTMLDNVRNASFLVRHNYFMNTVQDAMQALCDVRIPLVDRFDILVDNDLLIAKGSQSLALPAPEGEKELLLTITITQLGIEMAGMRLMPNQAETLHERSLLLHIRNVIAGQDLETTELVVKDAALKPYARELLPVLQCYLPVHKTPGADRLFRQVLSRIEHRLLPT